MVPHMASTMCTAEWDASSAAMRADEGRLMSMVRCRISARSPADEKRGASSRASSACGVRCSEIACMPSHAHMPCTCHAHAIHTPCTPCHAHAHAHARLCGAEHAEPISEESELHKRCPLQLLRHLRTWLGLGLGLGLDACSNCACAPATRVHSALSLNDKPYRAIAPPSCRAYTRGASYATHLMLPHGHQCRSRAAAVAGAGRGVTAAAGRDDTPRR
eukprot:scaffold32337_cov63-Phaeocystis_antarctica.AAC.2